MKLQRMVRAIKRDIDATFLPLIKLYAPDYTMDGATVTRDGWVEAIAAALQLLVTRWENHPGIAAIAGDFVRTAFTSADRRAMRSMGIDVFGSSTEMDEYLRAAMYQNVKLIKSIPAQYLEQVGNILMTNMRIGNRPGYIVKELQQQFGVTQRRAKFIARDQSAKIAGEVSKKRQIAAGYSYFVWVDSHDQRVRHSHRDIANRVTAYGKGVYRWDDLPVNERGERIQPGSDYNCRCVAKVISNRNVERNQERGLTDPNVLR